MKENNVPEKNRAIIDSILIKLECILFVKHSGIEIPEEELDEIISLVKKLVEFDEEYIMMQEENKIMWLKIQQLEDEIKALHENKKDGDLS